MRKYRNYKLENSNKYIARLKTKLEFEMSVLQSLKKLNQSPTLIDKAIARVDLVSRELRKKQTNLPR